MKRKEFIKRCGSICVSTSAVALLLQSCGGIHYATHTLEGNTIRLSKTEFIDSKNQEGNQRSFVIIKEAGLPFPIVVYKNGENLTALLMQCTHQGCEVNPNPFSLVCPCHGSEFDTDGKVINPPAEEPLKRYEITSDGSHYYIHLS